MKKTLIMSTVLFSAFMLCSCSDQDTVSPAGGEEGQVSFNIAVPGNMQSRAFADGTTAQNNVKYYVYDQDNAATPVLTGTVPMSSLKGTLTVSLATAHTYDIVFLATAAESPYSYDADARVLGVDYDNVVTSDEKLDAFYAVVPDLLVNGPSTQDVKLYRPFAQLNIGTDDVPEYQAALNSTIATTSVTVTGLYPSFDLMAGDVTGTPVNVTFAAAALPQGETFPVTYTPEGSTEAVPYTYLSMDYLLVNQTKDLVEVTLDVVNANGTVDKREYNNIPVQRNFRTNIFGSLLTAKQDFNVEILPGFIDPDYNLPVVATAQSFAAALADGGAVIPAGITINANDLAGDMSALYEINDPAEIVVNGTLSNTEGGQFLINSELTISGSGTIESTKRGMLWLQEGGKLNVSGVTINTPAHDRGAGTWITGGEAHYDGVTFNSGSGTINTQPGSNAIVTVKNCTVNNTSSNKYGSGWSYALNFNDGTITIENTTATGVQGVIACVRTAKVTINSGKYSTANSEPGRNDAWGALYVSGDAVATINGGSFYSPRKNYAAICGDNDVNNPYGNILLYGGEFSDKPWDSNTGRQYVIEPQEGYEYAETGDETYPWKVVKKQ